MNQSVLIKKQVSLQSQAQEVLKNLDLINLLSRYGKPRIVGSVALGLMTWPDIDIDLISKNEINEKDYFEIVQKLFDQENIKQLVLINNQTSFEKNRPRSVYLGIIFDLAGVDWKIDIRYLNSVDAYAGNDLEEIKAKITNDKIEAILEIKTAFHNHPKYRKEFSGYDIYVAVLNRSVSTVEEFEDYLKSKQVSI